MSTTHSALYKYTLFYRNLQDTELNVSEKNFTLPLRATQYCVVKLVLYRLKKYITKHAVPREHVLKRKRRNDSSVLIIVKYNEQMPVWISSHFWI